jgi:broad specificity phosphatase PhoE
MNPIKILIAATSLFALASAATAQQAVILVRHAEIPGAPMAEPKNLPLSEAGAARARRLAGVLKDAGVGAVYVTDFVRTMETAAPIARELNKEPTVLPKGDPKELVERLRKDHASQTVLLVGHSDTLPGLIKALGHPTDIRLEPQDFGNIFVVTPKGDGAVSLLRLRY